jgi:hypothetical protein
VTSTHPAGAPSAPATLAPCGGAPGSLSNSAGIRADRSWDAVITVVGHHGARTGNTGVDPAAISVNIAHQKRGRN